MAETFLKSKKVIIDGITYRAAETLGHYYLNNESGGSNHEILVRLGIANNRREWARKIGVKPSDVNVGWGDDEFEFPVVDSEKELAIIISDLLARAERGFKVKTTNGRTKISLI